MLIMVKSRPLGRGPLDPKPGGMAEWTKAPVLKTGIEQSIVGSNPTPSAKLIVNDEFRIIKLGIRIAKYHLQLTIHN